MLHLYVMSANNISSSFAVCKNSYVILVCGFCHSCDVMTWHYDMLHYDVMLYSLMTSRIHGDGCLQTAVSYELPFDFEYVKNEGIIHQ